jgi:hypothetical protein
MANTSFSVDGGISTDSLILSPSEAVLGTISAASVIGGFTTYLLNTTYSVLRNFSHTSGTIEIDIDTTTVTDFGLVSALTALPQNSGDSGLFIRVKDGGGGLTTTYPIAYSTNTNNGKGYYTYVVYLDAGTYASGGPGGLESISIGDSATFRYITTSSTLNTDLSGKTKFKVGLTTQNTENFTIASTYFEGSASISASVGDLVSSFDESTIGFSALPFGSTSSSVSIGYDPVIGAWKAGAAEVISGKVGRNAQPGGSLGEPNSVGIGLDALQNIAPDVNGGGNYNNALGYQALQDTNTGNGNIGLGGFAGRKITTGENNIAIGYATIYQGLTAATGDNNIAIGAGASAKITSAESNVGIGASSLTENLTGANNTAIGHFSGYFTLGSGNVFVGHRAGQDETGSNKLYISNSNTATPLIHGDFATGDVTINGNLNVTGTVPTASPTTTTASVNTAITIDSFALSAADSAEFTVKVTQGDRRYSSKSLALHNGTTVDLVQYGEISIAATETVAGTGAVSWTTRTSNFGTTDVHRVAFGNNLWVAAGGYGNIRTSTDGTTWTTRTSNFTNSFFGMVTSLTYANNIWLAATGFYGQLRASTDGTTWTTRTLNFGTDFGAEILSISYGNNLWVAAGGYGKLSTSTDAITWTSRTSNFGSNFTSKIQSVAFGNNLWVAAGWYGQIRTSTDAITWTTRTSNFGNTQIRSVAYGNSLWVAAGGSGQIRTSTDGTTWTTRTSNFGTTFIRSVAFSNSLWVAAGTEGQIRTSTDAITWTTQTSNFGASQVNTVAYGNSLWVAGGYGGQIRTSAATTASVLVPLTLSADISGSDVRLRATITDAATTNAEVKVLKTVL